MIEWVDGDENRSSSTASRYRLASRPGPRRQERRGAEDEAHQTPRLRPGA
ncbi:MAG: hypothetical protein U5K43_04470 [Halofilum sp. (in: g-proteobacteria)]|nr:hypothetical protein [Halofilum sp. (in: g-proteobacteria)]